MVSVEAAIAQLLCHHLGLDDRFADPVEQQQQPPPPRIKSFRDLLHCSGGHGNGTGGLDTLFQKQQLLQQAAMTCCSPVIMDVLLFVSQTLQVRVYMREIVKFPILIDHWLHYLSQRTENAFRPHSEEIGHHRSNSNNSLDSPQNQNQQQQYDEPREEAFDADLLLLVYEEMLLFIGVDMKQQQQKQLQQHQLPSSSAATALALHHALQHQYLVVHQLFDTFFKSMVLPPCRQFDNRCGSVNYEKRMLACIYGANQLDRFLAHQQRKRLRHLLVHSSPWILECWKQFIELCECQAKLELQDAVKAPKLSLLEGIFDKRARGKNNVQANWRKRMIRLQANQLVYSNDTNFLKKSKETPVIFTSTLAVNQYFHQGTIQNRPYCIKIEPRANSNTAFVPLVIDFGSEAVQMMWYQAIRGNIQRLSMDKTWLEFPRTSVLFMTVREVTSYLMLYHTDRAVCDRKSDEVSRFCDQFAIDPRRRVFVYAKSLARRRQWQCFEQLAEQQTKSPGMMAEVFDANAHTAGSEFIGIGPLVDIALECRASPQLVQRLVEWQHQHSKHDLKRAWQSVRRDSHRQESNVNRSNASTNAKQTVPLNIDISDALRAKNIASEW